MVTDAQFAVLFKEAGMRVTEVARILSLSRVTISTWKNQGLPKTFAPEDLTRVTNLIKLVEFSLQQNLLPLADDVTGKQRLNNFISILKQSHKILQTI